MDVATTVIQSKNAPVIEDRIVISGDSVTVTSFIPPVASADNALLTTLATAETDSSNLLRSETFDTVSSENTVPSAPDTASISKYSSALCLASSLLLAIESQ